MPHGMTAEIFDNRCAKIRFYVWQSSWLQPWVGSKHHYKHPGRSLQSNGIQSSHNLSYCGGPHGWDKEDLAKVDMAWSVGPRNGTDWSAPSGEILPEKLFGQVVPAVATVGISWTALASLVSNWPETIIDRKVVKAWNNQNIGRYVFWTPQNKIFSTFDVNGQF